MPTSQKSPLEQLQAAASDLARFRKRPCILLKSGCHIQHTDVLLLRDSLRGKRADAVDVVVASYGGDLTAAYLLIRELRRKFRGVSVFVPLDAKSAATLICLAADELVLGELGELGPLDAQIEEKQRGDFPQFQSGLERFKALEQLQRYSVETFDTLARVIVQHTGMKLLDACNIATDFTGKVCGPMYEQIDPARVGQSARHLEVGSEYAHRVLRRYRPQFYAEHGPTLIRKLVRSYPAHDFVIDREELKELGVPVRSPSGAEVGILAKMADVLIEIDHVTPVIEIAMPPSRRSRKKVPAKPKEIREVKP